MTTYARILAEESRDSMIRKWKILHALTAGDAEDDSDTEKLKLRMTTVTDDDDTANSH